MVAYKARYCVVFPGGIIGWLFFHGALRLSSKWKRGTEFVNFVSLWYVFLELTKTVGLDLALLTVVYRVETWLRLCFKNVEVFLLSSVKANFIFNLIVLSKDV